MTDVVVTEALGESLSAGQVNIYMMWTAKWYFRYLVASSEPATGSLALGKVFHGAVARNFCQKISAGREMQSAECAFRQE
jgi:hypothetical protein